LISGKKNGKWIGSIIDDIKAPDRRWQSIAGGIHEGLGPQRTKLSLWDLVLSYRWGDMRAQLFGRAIS